MNFPVKISNIKYTMLTGDRMGIEWKWEQGGNEKALLSVFRMIDGAVMYEKNIAFDEYSRALRHQHGIVVSKIDCPVIIRLEADGYVIEEFVYDRKYKITVVIKEKNLLLSGNKKIILEINNQSGISFEKSFLMYCISANKIGRADMIPVDSDGENFGFVPALKSGINQYMDFSMKKNQVFSVLCCDDEKKKWFDIKEEYR